MSSTFICGNNGSFVTPWAIQILYAHEHYIHALSTAFVPDGDTWPRPPLIIRNYRSFEQGGSNWKWSRWLYVRTSSRGNRVNESTFTVSGGAGRDRKGCSQTGGRRQVPDLYSLRPLHSRRCTQGWGSLTPCRLGLSVRSVLLFLFSEGLLPCHRTYGAL